MVNSRRKPSAKKKQRIRNNRIRRALKLLLEDEDSSEVLKDTGEFINKHFSKCSNEDWQKVVGSKNTNDANMRITSGTEKNLFNKPANGLSLHVYTSEGREDDVEEGVLSSKSLDLYPSENNSKLTSLQPIVLVEKLDNESPELTTYHRSSPNENTVTSFAPVRRRKFFGTEVTERLLPSTSNSSATDDGVNKTYSAHSIPKDFEAKGFKRKYLAYVMRSKGFEGKKDANLLSNGSISEKNVLSESNLPKNGKCNSVQLTDCITDLHKTSAWPPTAVRVSEESRTLIEIIAASKTEQSSCQRRTSSPLIHDGLITRENSEERSQKARRLLFEDNYEEWETLQEIMAANKTEQSSCQRRLKNGCLRTGEYSPKSTWFLYGDNSEEWEKVVAHQNERQSSQNGPAADLADRARETTKIPAESEQENSVCDRKKWLMSDLEIGFRCHFSGNVSDIDSYSESNTNCDAVERIRTSPISDVSGSSVRTSSVGCCKAGDLYTTSPSLQPTVVLRKLTYDEIRCYTSQRHELRQENAHNCVAQIKIIDSFKKTDEGAAHSCPKVCNRKFCNKHEKGCKNSYTSEVFRKRIFYKCSSAPSGDREYRHLCDQESQESENEGSMCEVEHHECTAKLLGSWNGTVNSPQNGKPSYHRCNGGRAGLVEDIVRCTSVPDTLFDCSNGKVSSIGDCNNTEVEGPYVSTGQGAPVCTTLATDKRKCCTNECCEVATPELIGLENAITSNRCWLNVTLQTLFAMESFMHSIVKAFEDVNVEGNSLLSCILRLFYARSHGHQECVYEEVSKLTEVLSKLNNDYVLNEQQDPSEFILWLFNAFEPMLEKYAPSWATGLITENFRFEMQERTCCISCMNFDVNTSSFLILMLDIHVGTSTLSTLEESLIAYTSTKTLRKNCSQCGENSSLVKTAFKSFPRYLIINLKRYSVKEGEVIRDETPVRHHHTLSLAQYSVDNGVSYSLKNRSSEPVTSSPNHNITRKSLRRTPGEYDLISIIHHSGYSVSSGHYVCDVYHTRTNKWYSYNDKMVKEINPATLQSTKKQGTGYIYVYQRRTV